MAKNKKVKVDPQEILRRHLAGAFETALKATALEILTISGFKTANDSTPSKSVARSRGVKRTVRHAKALSAKRAAAARQRWKKARKAA